MQPDIYQLVNLKREEITRLAGKVRRFPYPDLRTGCPAFPQMKSAMPVFLSGWNRAGRSLILAGLRTTEKLLGRPVDVCTLPLLREAVRERVVFEAIPL